MKTQLNARLSEATRAKLDDLTSVYGTQAEALAVAVDRLHAATFPQQTPPATGLHVGQRVTVDGWPVGTIEAVHAIGHDRKPNGVRIRFDSGARLVVKPSEVLEVTKDADVS